MKSVTRLCTPTLLVFAVLMSTQASALEKSWLVDPHLPGHVINSPPSPDSRHYEFSVATPVDGFSDYITYDALTGQWLAFGDDGFVVGGTRFLDSSGAVASKCAGPAMLLCIPGGLALICEIRRNVAVRRAQAQCAATGQGVQIHSQTGCANVRTSCTGTPRPPLQIQ